MLASTVVTDRDLISRVVSHITRGDRRSQHIGLLDRALYAYHSHVLFLGSIAMRAIRCGLPLPRILGHMALLTSLNVNDVPWIVCLSVLATAVSRAETDYLSRCRVSGVCS